MTKPLLASMREATRILQTRGPAEATAAIQRALQGIPLEVDAPTTAEVASADAVEGPTVASRPLLRSWVGATMPRISSAPLEQPTAEPPRAKGGRTDAPPGRFLSGSFANDAGAREYKLYVPSGYLGQALPLVVMLHGCTQTPDDFASGTRMNAAAEMLPCFVLYPAQAQRANGNRCWNWFDRGHQARDRGEPSILADLTREIIGKYGIDPRRVYVAGLSAGGAMAAVMKTTYPDLYAAVGVHSGLAYGAAHDLPSALQAMQGRGRRGEVVARGELTPLIVFHGDGDRTVHPRNGEQVLGQSVPADARAANDPRREVQRGRAPDGHPFTRTLYRDDAGRVIAEHWLVHGAAHAWSGGSPEGSHVDPAGPDATREMLRFFSQLR